MKLKNKRSQRAKNLKIRKRKKIIFYKYHQVRQMNKKEVKKIFDRLRKLLKMHSLASDNTKK